MGELDLESAPANVNVTWATAEHAATAVPQGSVSVKLPRLEARNIYFRHMDPARSPFRPCSFFHLELEANDQN